MLTEEHLGRNLAASSPELERILTHSAMETPAQFTVAQIRCETVWVPMRDGVRLATDLYLPPELSAPAIAMRTPYGRAIDAFVGAFLSFARRGYVVISQDCRGTGDSEPDSWDYCMYESEDGVDMVEWIGKQDWFSGFLGAWGGSYMGQTQWCMAMNPLLSTLIPSVSGLGIASNTVHLYMYLNAYGRAVGKGEGKVSVPFSDLERSMVTETMAGGYFNEPLHLPFSEMLLARYPELRTLAPTEAKRRLWEEYCAMTCAQRARLVKQVLGVRNVTSVDVESLSAIVGQRMTHDAHTLPHPRASELCGSLRAPPLMLTGWYDWGLNDALASWEVIRREANEEIASRSRLIITPSAPSDAPWLS